jgi:hypothetical protein
MSDGLSSSKGTRWYRITEASSAGISIRIPPGVVAVAIRRNEVALVWELADVSRVVDADGSSIIDTGTELAVDDGTLYRPYEKCVPGEYINIQSAAGTAAVDAFQLHVLCDPNPNLTPATVAGLIITETQAE